MICCTRALNFSIFKVVCRYIYFWHSNHVDIFAADFTSSNTSVAGEINQFLQHCNPPFNDLNRKQARAQRRHSKGTSNWSFIFLITFRTNRLATMWIQTMPLCTRNIRFGRLRSRRSGKFEFHVKSLVFTILLFRSF